MNATPEFNVHHSTDGEEAAVGRLATKPRITKNLCLVFQATH